MMKDACRNCVPFWDTEQTTVMANSVHTGY